MPYPTASVEILEDNHKHYICDVCPHYGPKPPAWALYNVFDGNGPKYACGRHLRQAVNQVATMKGGR